MSDKDFTISMTANVPTVGATSRKPAYLVILESNAISQTKSKTLVRFISLDKPESINGFIQVKGIYSDSTEEEIISNYSEILTSLKRELICEMMFPWHKVCSIRSLVFNAVKNQTLTR
jgi:hypothetical protein